MDDLSTFGWNDFFSSQIRPDESNLTVARVVEPLRGMSRAVCARGEIWAEKPDHIHEGGPAVGDWVVGELREHGQGEIRLVVARTLQRRNKLSRISSGQRNQEQVLGANLDTACIVLALNQEIRLPQVGRYLSMIEAAQITPVILLTKADTSADSLRTADQIREKNPMAQVHAISVQTEPGAEILHTICAPRSTTILLGASGAGKSSIVNFLLGSEARKVDGVREKDQKGRHTTTARRLTLLPSGALLIDSPGMREMEPWVEPTQSKPREKPSHKKKPKARSLFRYTGEE